MNQLIDPFSGIAIETRFYSRAPSSLHSTRQFIIANKTIKSEIRFNSLRPSRIICARESGHHWYGWWLVVPSANKNSYPNYAGLSIYPHRVAPRLSILYHGSFRYRKRYRKQSLTHALDLYSRCMDICIQCHIYSRFPVHYQLTMNTANDVTRPQWVTEGGWFNHNTTKHNKTMYVFYRA